MATTHECPAPGCTRQVPRHQLACRPDWYRLPRELRDAINDAYRHDTQAHSQLLREAYAWYRDHPRDEVDRQLVERAVTHQLDRLVADRRFRRPELAVQARRRLMLATEPLIDREDTDA